MIRVFHVLITLGLVIAACTSIKQGGETLVVPSSWKLESLGKSGAETPVIPDSNVTLQILDSGQVSGSGGCNSFGAAYEMKGNTLVIKNLVSTLMACLDDKISAQETEYLNALQSATGFGISGETLTIFYDDGQSQLNFVQQ